MLYRASSIPLLLTVTHSGSDDIAKPNTTDAVANKVSSEVPSRTQHSFLWRERLRKLFLLESCRGVQLGVIANRARDRTTKGNEKQFQ